jgi:hypothetical protein
MDKSVLHWTASEDSPDMLEFALDKPKGEKILAMPEMGRFHPKY